MSAQLDSTMAQEGHLMVTPEVRALAEGIAKATGPQLPMAIAQALAPMAPPQSRVHQDAGTYFRVTGVHEDGKSYVKIVRYASGVDAINAAMREGIQRIVARRMEDQEEAARLAADLEYNRFKNSDGWTRHNVERGIDEDLRRSGGML